MIKSISDINTHFQRSHIPDDYSRRYDTHIDEIKVIAGYGKVIDAIIIALNYGFSKGWRAAMKYQKEKDR